MIQHSAVLDAAEQRQFAEAFDDNLDLLLELVEVVRCESTHAEDYAAADFMAGVSRIIHAFRDSHIAEDRFAAVTTESAWSSDRESPTQTQRCEPHRAPPSFDIG